MTNARPFSEEEVAQFDRMYADLPDQYKHDTLLKLRATIAERDKRIKELTFIIVDHYQCVECTFGCEKCVKELGDVYDAYLIAEAKKEER